MSNSRTVQISIDHLVSEVAAFPLASRFAFESPLLQIDPAMRGPTLRLWRQVEPFLTSRFPHVGLDELISMRNSVWFGYRSQGMDSLTTYVKRLASLWLVSRGANAEPKFPCGPQDPDASAPAARRAWRWMTFALPGDLLLAGLSENGRGPVRVNVLASSVEALLREGGYAETHLHLGAALDFPTVWASAMNLVARSPEQSPGIKWDAFASPGADHGEGKHLAQWMIRSAIVRYFLAAFFRTRAKSESFQQFIRRAHSLLSERFLGANHLQMIRWAFSDLANGKATLIDEGGFAATFSAMQSAYNALTGASTHSLPKQLDEVQAIDPLATFFPSQGYAGPSVQLQFLWAGMRYLSTHADDYTCATLFWQTERVRGQVYRHCVQRPLTPGLMNFIRFYDRKGAVTGPLENIELESAGSLGGIGHGLRSLEVRASPNSDFETQLLTLHNWRSQAQMLGRRVPTTTAWQQRRLNGRLHSEAWRNAECGVVLHYLKFRGEHADAGSPQAFDLENHADPGASQNSNHYRWQAFSRKTGIHANAISDALRRDPDLLYFLRGLDVCRDEHGVPTWVISPMFARVQHCVAGVAEEQRCRSRPELPRLRTTVHVGEDFVHLATGLRYMDEAIEHIPLGCGDRIGHGLALGIEANEWAERSMRLAMPCEDRWLDLIWERSWHSHPESRFSSNRRTFVDDEIVRLSFEIFGDEHKWTSRDAAQLVAWLNNLRAMKRLGFPNGQLPQTPSTGLTRQLERYLTEPLLYRRCRAVEWIAVRQEGPAVAELQRLVRQRYALAGITIEVNPVSNLLVGDLTDLNSHPLWRISPGLGHDVDATLRICVGSDDPFPFATSLPEEYQFLFDSLVLAGRSHAEARQWLDHIRQLGVESRFTMPADTLHNRDDSPIGRTS